MYECKQQYLCVVGDRGPSNRDANVCWAFRTRPFAKRDANCFVRIDCQQQLVPLRITEHFAFDFRFDVG